MFPVVTWAKQLNLHTTVFVSNQPKSYLENFQVLIIVNVVLKKALYLLVKMYWLYYILTEGTLFANLVPAEPLVDKMTYYRKRGERIYVYYSFDVQGLNFAIE